MPKIVTDLLYLLGRGKPLFIHLFWSILFTPIVIKGMNSIYSTMAKLARLFIQEM